MLTRATSIYLSMLAVFAIGLWAILTAGSTLLRAPTDLAGDWELESPKASSQAGKNQRMNIDQSGRFLRISIDGRDLSLVLQSERDLDEERGSEIRLAGQGIDMVLTGFAESDELELQSQGTVSGLWTAVRTTRRHQTRGADSPASRPA